MIQNISELVEAYLEGRLSAEETDRIERDLLQPEVASAFREALVFRDLLHHLPPDAPPSGLSDPVAVPVDGSEIQ